MLPPPALTKADDAVSVTALIDNPGTTEEAIAAHGALRTAEQLSAAMARTPKGPVLIDALVSALGRTWNDDGTPAADVDTKLLALLGEPALNAGHLTAMAAVMAGRCGATHARLAAAICSHPLTGAVVVIWALWGSDLNLIQNVTRARGDLLPLATWWVRHTTGAGGPTAGLFYLASPAQCDLIADTVRTWGSWAGDDHRRVAYLITNAGSCIRADALLAAGEALTAEPTSSSEL